MGTSTFLDTIVLTSIWPGILGQLEVMVTKENCTAEINMSKFLINESQVITVKFKWEGTNAN